MRYVSIGDLAQSFQLRRNTVEAQSQLQRLASEMSSGQKADIGRAVSGDFTALAAIERSLDTLEGFRLAADEAILAVETAQAALGVVDDILGTVAPNLAASTTTGGAAQVDAVAADARARFDSIVAALNAGAAGRYVLSGTATDSRPVADAGDMLAALAAAVSGETTVSGVTDAVSQWFDAPPGAGGYLDLAYRGSDAPLAPFRVGQSDSVAFEVTAADPAVRDAMKGFAVAALVAGGLFAGDAEGRALLVRAAGEAMLSAQGGITALRAGVGTAEARLAEAQARNSAEITAFEIARARIVAADPYETATALDKAQGQLELLYTITARLSRLSFADYLR